MDTTYAATWVALFIFLASVVSVEIALSAVIIEIVAKRYANDHAEYLTLLMSTGLTFGTISAFYGLQAGHISSTQFSVLVAVVIATAVIPTLIAQRWFSPALPEQVREEVLAQEEESL